MPDDAQPPDDLPGDLVAALERLHAEYPGSWLEILADAVVAEGGTDAADLLGMAADRAAAGHPRDDECDPEQALLNLEADIKELERMDGQGVDPATIDLLAELPPVSPLREPKQPSDN